MSGWDQLLCEYFCDEVANELSPYMSSYGFFEVERDKSAVLYGRGDVYVEIGYNPESAPKYALSLNIGVGKTKYDANGLPVWVPAWNVILQAKGSENYSFWRFGDEVGLREVLEKTRLNVIERYLRPLWENEDALRDYICRFRKEF